MYNCFFEDADLYFKIKPIGSVCLDSDGYFIKSQIIYKASVIDLLKIGVVPIFDEDLDIFFIKIYITNKTSVKNNGQTFNTINSIGSERRIVIKECALKRYSDKHPKSQHTIGRACYAVKLLIRII